MSLHKVFISAIFGAVILAGGDDLAQAYPAPYTCSRNFYVSTSGRDTSACGATGSPCATIQGANDALSIGSTGTRLQGGDCVNVAAGTYNRAGTMFLTQGGNAGSASGYVTYVGAPNHGSKTQLDNMSHTLIAPFTVLFSPLHISRLMALSSPATITSTMFFY
jgi:hypothetical protein